MHIPPKDFESEAEKFLSVYPNGIAFEKPMDSKVLRIDKIYFHIQRRRFSADWLAELRLQNLAAFDIRAFLSYGDRSVKSGLPAALRAAADFVQKMKKERR